MSTETVTIDGVTYRVAPGFDHEHAGREVAECFARLERARASGLRGWTRAEERRTNKRLTKLLGRMLGVPHERFAQLTPEVQPDVRRVLQDLVDRAGLGGLS